MKTPALLRLSASLTALSAAAYACSGDTGIQDTGLEKPSAGSSPTGGLVGGGPSAGNGATSGGSTGSGATGNGTGGTGTIMVDASPMTDAAPDVNIDPDAACGTGSAEASLLPVNIMMMFDRSGSMVNADYDDPVTMLSRWETATMALTTFFQDPQADGLGVALRFFPHDEPVAGCTAEDGACNVDACTTPLVDMGMLSADPAPTDVHEAALISAIMTSAPPEGRSSGPGTPIYPALDGALRWAAQYQMDNPDQKTVVLLVTDGEPNGCNEDWDEIHDLAAEALDAAGINTYAIGLADAMGNGVSQADMDGLAEAGGTENAFFISDGPTAASDLIETLNEIRGMALSCEFAVPEATSSGDEIDPGLVNVNYTSGAAVETTFTKVPNAAACTDSMSWYYDDELNPQRILLCPAACSAVSADAEAKLEILAGCVPIIEPPA